MDKSPGLTPFEQQLKAVLAVPQPSPDYVKTMRETLLKRPIRRSVSRPLVTRRWLVPAAFILLLVAVFLLSGPERVIAAARSWLQGFIPGVGFVSDETDLRVLDRPVHVDIDGASLIVEKAYTNADGTAVQIAHLGDERQCKITSETYEENRSRLQTASYLLLPDGTKLYTDTPRFFDWGQFPALPPDVDEAILVFPPQIRYRCPQGEQGEPTTFCHCLDPDLQWAIPLAFSVPAPGTVLPVIDSVAPTPEPTLEPTASSPVTVSATSTPAQEQLQPRLAGKLVELEDGYFMIVGLENAETEGGYFSFGMNEHKALLFDASGAEIPVEEVDRSEINQAELQDLPWRDYVFFRTHTKAVSGPLTLTMTDLVQGRYNFGEEAGFEVDLQPNLGSTQTQPFDFIPGHPFSLKDVRVTGSYDDFLGVSFYFEGNGFETISVQQDPLPEGPPQGGSSGLCDYEFPGCFYTETSLPITDGGMVRLKVGSLEYHVLGFWPVTFDLPANP